MSIKQSHIPTHTLIRFYQLLCFFEMSLLIYLLAINVIQECRSHYVGQQSRKIRFMMYALERELIRDSTQKVKSVQHIKTYYVRYPAFQTAERVYSIRRKLARMIRLYMISFDDYRNSFLQHTKTLDQIHQLGTDIDHLVEMLVEWEKNPYNTVIRIGSMEIPEDVLNDLKYDMYNAGGNAGRPELPSRPGGSFGPSG